MFHFLISLKNSILCVERNVADLGRLFLFSDSHHLYLICIGFFQVELLCCLCIIIFIYLVIVIYISFKICISIKIV